MDGLESGDGFATQGVVGAGNHFVPRASEKGLRFLELGEDVTGVVTEGEGELVVRYPGL